MPGIGVLFLISSDFYLTWQKMKTLPTSLWDFPIFIVWPIIGGNIWKTIVNLLKWVFNKLCSIFCCDLKVWLLSDFVDNILICQTSGPTYI